MHRTIFGLCLVFLALQLTATPAQAVLRCLASEACMSNGDCDLKFGGGPFMLNNTGDGVEVHRLVDGEISPNSVPDMMRVLALPGEGMVVLTTVPSDKNAGPAALMTVYGGARFVMSAHIYRDFAVFGVASSGRCEGKW